MEKTKENAYKEEIKSKARRQEKKSNNPCLAVEVSADGYLGGGGWLGVCDSGASFLRVHNRFIERQRLPLGTTFIYFLAIILLCWLCSAFFVVDKDVRRLLVYLQI